MIVVTDNINPDNYESDNLKLEFKKISKQEAYSMLHKQSGGFRSFICMVLSSKEITRRVVHELEIPNSIFEMSLPFINKVEGSGGSLIDIDDDVIFVRYNYKDLCPVYYIVKTIDEEDDYESDG